MLLVSELDAHFVGGLEAEGFVKRPPCLAGMEGDNAEAVRAGPFENHLQETLGDTASAGLRFGVHVKNPGALGERFARKAGPIGENDTATGKNGAGRVFNQPGLIGAIAEGLPEILFRGSVDAVKRSDIRVTHVFEHGATVMDEMRKIGQSGFADAAFHDHDFAGNKHKSGRDKMVLARKHAAPDRVRCSQISSDIVLSMRRVALTILCEVFLAAGIAQAQTGPNTEVTIATERPTVASASTVVPLGGFQVENGMLATDQQGHWVLDLPESLIRYGLLRKTEVRLYVPNYYHDFATGGAADSGFGDIAFGAQQQLGPVAGFDVSLIAFVSCPTGANGVSSHGYDPALQVPLTRNISEHWIAGTQASFYWPTQGRERNFTKEGIFFLDRQLTKPWDVFVEYAGDFPEHGGSRQQIHFGTTYKITPRQQFDFHFAFGLTGAAPKGYVGIGYSFLILTRRER